MPTMDGGPKCLFEKLDAIDKENSQLHEEIVQEKAKYEELNSVRTEIMNQINRTG